MKNTWIIVALIILFSASCRKGSEKPAQTAAPAPADSIMGLVVADTIIYDVNIVSSNTDDPWESQKLRHLHYDLLVDNIFKMVYDGKALAYNHETGEKLTIKKIEKMESEAGFSRRNIGMIQFKEAWFLNPEIGSMNKKVISMVLGVPRYGDDGSLIGHKALFRVELPDF